MYLKMVRTIVILFALLTSAAYAQKGSETELKEALSVARKTDQIEVRIEYLLKSRDIILSNSSIEATEELLSEISYFLDDRNTRVLASAAEALSAFGPRALPSVGILKRAFLKQKRYDCTLSFHTGVTSSARIVNAIKAISGEDLSTFKCPPQKHPGCNIKIRFTWGALLLQQWEIYPFMTLPWRWDYIEDVHYFGIWKQSEDVDIAQIAFNLPCEDARKRTMDMINYWRSTGSAIPQFELIEASAQ